MKIAIVDDSSLDRDFLKNGLEIIFEERNIENLEIQEFSSGEELLNYLRENPSDFFHIIFMDIYMEDLTGVETAKAIRKTDEQVKIVFITTSNEFASESYEVRAEDYLIKPFDGQRMHCYSYGNSKCSWNICNNVFTGTESFIFTAKHSMLRWILFSCNKRECRKTCICFINSI